MIYKSCFKVFFMSKASVRQSQYELLHRESNKNGTIVIF